MKKTLHEDFFSHMSELDGSSDAIKHLAEKQISAHAVAPPAEIWFNIQKKIRETPIQKSAFGFTEAFKNFFSPPLVPALAVGIIGIMVTAFVLLSQGSVPAQTPLVELSAVREQTQGQVIAAKGLQIENTSTGAISHSSGAVEKIVIASGSWKMKLNHSELEKPIEFTFPGGVLSPIGTAFTLKVSGDTTAIDLTEGKIKLTSGIGASLKTETIVAPYQGYLTAPPKPAVESEQKPVVASRYASMVGTQVVIELKNGDRLSGRIKSANAGRLILAGQSGNLTVREADIQKIQRN